MSLQQLYEHLRNLPPPELGKHVKDFALYEALLVGFADRVVSGEVVDLSQLPVPDEETVKQIDVLRQKDQRTSEEKDFLEYFGVLEEMRSKLARS